MLQKNRRQSLDESQIKSESILRRIWENKLCGRKWRPTIGRPARDFHENTAAWTSGQRNRTSHDIVTGAAWCSQLRMIKSITDI